MPIETGFGVTTMVASGPTVTMTVAVPEILSLLALTVLANVPGVVPAVNRPDALIVPPPATTDQVGVSATVAPEKSLPTAENCCVPFAARVCGFGETTIDDRVPGELIPCTSHPAVNNPANAAATKTRATRLSMSLFIELLPTRCM